MNLNLTIKKKSDPSFFQELEFSSFPVYLGREEDIDIPLPDPFRIISRKHAQILNTEGILQLMDLGSANFTYLNDQKLKAREENPLTTGDTIRIGEYELQVQLKSRKEESKLLSEDDNKTIVFASQYDDEISNIAENLKKIAEKYFADDSPAKSDALRFTLGQAFSGIDIQDVKNILAGALSGDVFKGNISTQAKNTNQAKKSNGSHGFEPSESSETDQLPGLFKKLQPEHQAEHYAGFSGEYPFSPNFTGILDSLLEMFSKLTQGFLYFRQEFFGSTIFNQIPAESLKDLKEYLFNPAISVEEELKRANLLREETQKLLAHHASLLEGYKSSVTEGSRLLLQSLDPENPGDDSSKHGHKEKSLSEGLFPGLNKSKKTKLLTEKLKKYIADPYYVEKKFFRPPFIKGYQKRITDKSLSQF